MSATTAFGAGKSRRPPTREPLLVRGFVLGTIALDIAILAAGAVASREAFVHPGWDLIAWIAVVAAIGVASVQFESGQQLGLDMPVLLSVGYLFGPVVAGAVAFTSYIDIREIRREIPLERALFNRAQTSLSVIAASAVFAALGGGQSRWPLTLLAALLAVGTDCLVNYGTVVIALCLHDRLSPLEGFSRLYFGSLREFAVTYASFGLVSLILAEVYESVGAWSLAILAIPLLLARQAFAGHKKVEGANRRAASQAEVLRDVSSAIANERREERLTLAAGLHDEVLPPLYKVHLMGQVLRQDLAAGRLLALEDDLPELLQATERASESMRSLIRSLRDSPLGAGGLQGTLALLVEFLQRESGVRINQHCEQVGGTPLIQLLTYQVAREALRNALRHSRATEISVNLTDQEGNLWLTVEDNGIGFDIDSVDRQHHFGLTLMRERIELAGGVLEIDSKTGEGTRMLARLPSAQIAR